MIDVCFLVALLMVKYVLFESIWDTSWCMRGSNLINYSFNVVVQETYTDGSFSFLLMFWESYFMAPATL